MSRPLRERRCALCGKPQQEEFRPFCSKRCRTVDLARWLGEGYAIPAVEPPGSSPDLPEAEE